MFGVTSLHLGSIFFSKSGIWKIFRGFIFSENFARCAYSGLPLKSTLILGVKLLFEKKLIILVVDHFGQI